MAKIQNKTQLRKVLHSGNFHSITVWQDGSWADTGNGSVENGMYGVKIAHANFYDVTHDMITEKFAEVEDALVAKGELMEAN